MRRFVAIAITAAILSTACSGGFLFSKKPWRDYSRLPFSEENWKAGDTLERGRMRHDMMEKLEGKPREEVLRLLGEPDEFTTKDGVEYIWYYTEHPGRRNLLKTPISFGKNNKAVFGIVE
jgi:hypothetical protein